MNPLDSLLRALDAWPRDRVPHNPAGGLYRAARNEADRRLLAHRFAEQFADQA